MKKTILITGASSGIGRSTALLLGAEGARLALAARRLDRLQEPARAIEEAGGVPPLLIQADVSRREDVQAMVEKTRLHFGRLDVLINNAALLYMEPFLGMPLERQEELMRTNYWSVVHALQAALPVMEAQGGGHVITVASVSGRRGSAWLSAYAATKFALVGLTESLRLEMAVRNVRFTLVHPGGVDTDMLRLVDRSRLPAGYPRRRPGIGPERCARAIRRAIRSRPLEVYVPWWLRFPAWLSVVWPGLADRLLRAAQRIGR